MPETSRKRISQATQELFLKEGLEGVSMRKVAKIAGVSAAAIYLAWSHRGRIRNDAAFAALAGVAPIPASSGQTTRHRLNRGGDRQLNRALHTITLSGLACHPETQAYVTRRTAEGKTSREIDRKSTRLNSSH